MQQFSVYENLHEESKTIYPYLLNIQHPIHNRFESMLVIPLVRKRKPIPNLTPEIVIEKSTFLAYTPEMLTMYRSMVGKEVCSLSHRSSEFINAVDFLITGF